MKTWKQALAAIIAICGIVVIITACDNNNGKTDPKCECPNGTDHWADEACCLNNNGTITVNCNCNSIALASGDHTTNTPRFDDEIDGCYVMFNGQLVKRKGDNCTSAGSRPIVCECPNGKAHEPEDYPCCEGEDCTCTIAEPAVRDFNDKVMFADGGTDYMADIVDARTQAGSKTLEQTGTVTQFQDVIAAAFASVSNPVKNRFRNVFNPAANTKGKIQITIENGVEYASYEIDDSATIRFNIDYLSTVSDADLQAAIIVAVQEMNGQIAMLERSTTRGVIHMAKAAPFNIKSMLASVVAPIIVDAT